MSLLFNWQLRFSSRKVGVFPAGEWRASWVAPSIADGSNASPRAGDKSPAGGQKTRRGTKGPQGRRMVAGGVSLRNAVAEEHSPDGASEGDRCLSGAPPGLCPWDPVPGAPFGRPRPPSGAPSGLARLRSSQQPDYRGTGNRAGSAYPSPQPPCSLVPWGFSPTFWEETRNWIGNGQLGNGNIKRSCACRTGSS